VVVLSDEIKRATGEETVVSDLTYDLRSGSPDFVDRMVGFTFAGMAMDALVEDKSGLMTAINQGRYVMAPIPDPKLGPPMTPYLSTVAASQRFLSGNRFSGETSFRLRRTKTTMDRAAAWYIARCNGKP